MRLFPRTYLDRVHFIFLAKYVVPKVIYRLAMHMCVWVSQKVGESRKFAEQLVYVKNKNL